MVLGYMTTDLFVSGLEVVVLGSMTTDLLASGLNVVVLV